ncbi:unnamed protein product [marine sediment metagenome]|uniref:Membrane-bound metal-dependent hydrolase n=1 Tax=marine sediment metagenome TaxID=412755 RepID=X0SXK8_9ZZZZ
MFIGHYAVAFAAKKPAPETSLGTLFLAAQFVDHLWPIFSILGLEHVRIAPGITAVVPLDFYDYPYSHSLLAAVVWALAFALIYFAVRRYPRGAWVVGAAVLSHWLLDLLTHRPDLPLAPGSDTVVGLGLWNSFAGTVVVEGALFLVGVVIYSRMTRAKDKTGHFALWGLVAFLVVMYVVNLLGPPPPNESVIPYVGLALWLFVGWAYWIDRHREVVGRKKW